MIDTGMSVRNSGVSTSRAAKLFDAFQPFCRRVRFRPGDLLREQGVHYRDMYLITDGRVEIALGVGGLPGRVVTAGATPIGEIGFLRGCPATATCIAKTEVDALVIDDPALAQIGRQQPALAAELLRYLAIVAEERTSFNLVGGANAKALSGLRTIEVYLCRNQQMLEQAQRLRYQVYCGELGRQSPNADHDRKIIADDLDATGNTFIAVEAGETIGTLRGNRSADGSLGGLADLYGMTASARHPAETAICTKFIIKKAKRGGSGSIKLISAMVRFGLRNNIKECYIDCIPALLPYYKAIGLEIVGPQFFHRENGPSYPMMIDVVRHGDRLSREAGVRDYLVLIVRAKAIGWYDRLRGYPDLVPTPRERRT